MWEKSGEETKERKITARNKSGQHLLIGRRLAKHGAHTRLSLVCFEQHQEDLLKVAFAWDSRPTMAIPKELDAHVWPLHCDFLPRIGLCR